MQRTGLVVGGEIDLVYGKLLLPITIQGVVDYFPTMYNAAAGYIIVNQKRSLLLRRRHQRSRQLAPCPRKRGLTLLKDPERAGRRSQASFLDSFGIPSGQVIDSQTILEQVRTDPVVRAGGSGILLVALVAAFAILALGFCADSLPRWPGADH